MKKFDEILDSSKSLDDNLGIYFPLGEIVPNAAAQTKRLQWKDGKLEDVKKWDVEEDVSSIVELQTLRCRLRLGPMLANDGGDSEKHLDSDENDNKEFTQIYKELVDEFGEISTDGKEQTKESLLARPHKMFYVGGALKNISIVKKMSQIFGLEDGNYTAEVPNACALGGVYKASWGFLCVSSG